jgi:heme-degrading monooxygenase HmoA
MTFLADLFDLPYYTVIFASSRTGADAEGYSKTADLMMSLAAQQEGFLGVESVGTKTEGLTVSYWQDEDSITKWRAQADHVVARLAGNETWYQDYRLRVAKVERAYKKQ